MFKERLLEIEQELKAVYKTNVMEKVVKDRLTLSLSKYVDNLERTCRYVLTQSPKVVKALLNKK